MLLGDTGQARRLLPPGSGADRCWWQQAVADDGGKLGDHGGLTSPLIASRSTLRLGVACVQVAEKLGCRLLVDPIAGDDAVSQPPARGTDRLDRVTVQGRAACFGFRIADSADQSATICLRQ